jgi:hypothetical protein
MLTSGRAAAEASDRTESAVIALEISMIARLKESSKVGFVGDSDDVC